MSAFGVTSTDAGRGHWMTQSKVCRSVWHNSGHPVHSNCPQYDPTCGEIDGAERAQPGTHKSVQAIDHHPPALDFVSTSSPIERTEIVATTGVPSAHVILPPTVTQTRSHSGPAGSDVEHANTRHRLRPAVRSLQAEGPVVTIGLRIVSPPTTRWTHSPSVVLRSRLSVGVQMEGVALARRGLQAIGGSTDAVKLSPRTSRTR